MEADLFASGRAETCRMTSSTMDSEHHHPGNDAHDGPKPSGDSGWTWQSDAEFLAAISNTQADLAAVELDPALIMQMIVSRTQALTRADGAVIELVEGDQMAYREACGMLAAHVGLRVPIASSLSGLCATGGEAIYCPDTEADPRTDPARCRRMGI